MALALAVLGAAEARTLPRGTVADLVIVEKSERRLTLSRKGKPLKVYRVALGPQPVGHKEQEGDGRTPEGRYVIDFRRPDSAYHRALHISYPNASDLKSAKKRGVSAGGDIMIHGLPNGLGLLGAVHLALDWTAGCIAVTNAEIEEIWSVVPNGTPIEIRP